MTIKINSVNEYLVDGCGRCKHHATPQCKVNLWRKELVMLRSIALENGFKEVIKWGMPCYTYNGANVFIISAFKEYCSINFFKGSLLNDAQQLLIKPGENTQGGRQLRFTNLADIKNLEKDIVSFLKEAKNIEESGKKMEKKNLDELPIPLELEIRFKKDTVFKKAFKALTPGRQRGYLIFFSAAKQSNTRISRIEKNIDNILKGKGLNE